MDPKTAHTLVSTDYKDPPSVVYPWQMCGGMSGKPEQGSGIGEADDPMYTMLASARQHGVIYAVQAPGAQPNINGSGYKEEGPMYTLDTTTPHGVVHPEIIPTLLASGVGCDRMGGMGGMGGNETEFVIVHPDTIGTLMTTAGASKNIDVEHLPVMKSKTGYVARRLMPVECERLQGFPDFWTDIIVKGKPAADAPRYRGLGNSVAVPVLRWIGRRLQVASKDSMA